MRLQEISRWPGDRRGVADVILTYPFWSKPNLLFSWKKSIVTPSAAALPFEPCAIFSLLSLSLSSSALFQAGLQFGMGLLSVRWNRIGAADRPHSGAHRPIVETSGKLADPAAVRAARL